MTTSRRTILAGLAGLGATASLPAWAQAIRAQSDPWAQVDPYADERNGFPRERPAELPRPQAARRSDMLVGEVDEMVFLNEKEEVALAREYYPGFIRDSGGAHPDAHLQAALRSFCRPMFAVADRPNLPWEVTLCRDESVNASAFAAGKVIVHVGLIRVCDRAGELAATIAHEIGHVDKRHTTRRQSVREFIFKLRADGKQFNPDLPLDTLIPGSAGELKDVLHLFELAYSREDEAEADAHEMVILERLGVDPIHAINDQWNFAQIGSDHANELVMSHPRDENRMEHIKALAAMQKKPKQDYVFPGWDLLKAAFPTLPKFKKV